MQSTKKEHKPPRNKSGSERKSSKKTKSKNSSRHSSAEKKEEPEKENLSIRSNLMSAIAE